MSAPCFLRSAKKAPRKPMIGVLCCNEMSERPIQAVASRFIEPLSRISSAAVVLVPALSDVCDALTLVDRLDGLLLTGSRSNVSPARYGSDAAEDRLDEQRDEVALRLAGHMIEQGRPVFGICRGLQELNVLFGGTLAPAHARHQRQGAAPFEALFDHGHEVRLEDGGVLATSTGSQRLRVNSVHEQGIDRLGAGLKVEARSVDDDLVEAFSAQPCGGPVMGVQWHPEWQADASPAGRAFFKLIGAALHRTQSLHEADR
jgi:putative glutamine amidotransferase